MSSGLFGREVHKEGYVSLKRRSYFRRRWLVLDGPVLRSFLEPQDTTARAEVNLVSCVISRDAVEGRHFRFRISDLSNGQEWHCRVDDAVAFDSWMAALAGATSVLRSGTLGTSSRLLAGAAAASLHGGASEEEEGGASSSSSSSTGGPVMGGVYLSCLNREVPLDLTPQVRTASDLLSLRQNDWTLGEFCCGLAVRIPRDLLSDETDRKAAAAAANWARAAVAAGKWGSGAPPSPSSRRRGGTLSFLGGFLKMLSRAVFSDVSAVSSGVSMAILAIAVLAEGGGAFPRVPPALVGAAAVCLFGTFVALLLVAGRDCVKRVQKSPRVRLLTGSGTRSPSGPVRGRGEDGRGKGREGGGRTVPTGGRGHGGGLQVSGRTSGGGEVPRLAFMAKEVVEAPADSVRHLLSDPARRREWDPLCVSVEVVEEHSAFDRTVLVVQQPQGGTGLKRFECFRQLTVRASESSYLILEKRLKPPPPLSPAASPGSSSGAADGAAAAGEWQLLDWGVDEDTETEGDGDGCGFLVWSIQAVGVGEAGGAFWAQGGTEESQQRRRFPPAPVSLVSLLVVPGGNLLLESNAPEGPLQREGGGVGGAAIRALRRSLGGGREGRGNLGPESVWLEGWPKKLVGLKAAVAVKEGVETAALPWLSLHAYTRAAALVLRDQPGGGPGPLSVGTLGGPGAESRSAGLWRSLITRNFTDDERDRESDAGTILSVSTRAHPPLTSGVVSPANSPRGASASAGPGIGSLPLPLGSLSASAGAPTSLVGPLPSLPEEARSPERGEGAERPYEQNWNHLPDHVKAQLLEGAERLPQAEELALRQRLTRKIDFVIARLLRLQEDTEWNAGGGKDGVKLMKKERDPGVPRDLPVVRGDLLFPSTIGRQQLISFLTDTEERKKYDDMFETAQLLYPFGPELFISWMCFKKQFGTSSREFLQVTAVREVDRNRSVVATVSLDESADGFAYPVESGRVRGDIALGGYVVTTRPDERLEVSFITQVDVCGSIPQFVVNMVQQNQPLTLAAVLRRMQAAGISRDPHTDREGGYRPPEGEEEETERDGGTETEGDGQRERGTTGSDQTAFDRGLRRVGEREREENFSYSEAEEMRREGESLVPELLRLRDSSGGWVNLGKRQGVEISRLDFPEGGPSLVRGRFVFAPWVTKERLLRLLRDFEARKTYDKLFEEGRILEEWYTGDSGDSMGPSLRAVVFSTKAVFGVSGREFVHYILRKQIDQRSIVLAMGAVGDQAASRINTNPSKVRGRLMKAAHILRELDNGSLEVVFLSQAELNGLIPGWIVKQAQGDLPTALANMQTFLEKER
uniref:START domain-containing protein n=1 Tax=Chromera velia CCMP2878 TaxID=1169474 RepID=A0A0G4HZ68_9ALVE|eukprot:Cvel_9658.t1-p1 / transcript=Cvel_9658.t1 / gene=Cvel_9658 / organism=Chromera_velia_CCMP2878 / gene_product=hypothetical protein / transcript_product=hypothetical protein / location=Cvel_scaffold562:27892-42836(+) / protein_length=1314 / sequence_SO=supercontig / SO=protein_coding / is_pseudo=false